MLAHTAEVTFLAKTVDDLEGVRKAAQNRHRSWVQSGFASEAAAAQAQVVAQELLAVETKAIRQLEEAMRVHPLGPFVKSMAGLGDKQAGRLIAAIGDPYWNDLHDRPRSLYELNAYCGYHVLRSGHSSPAGQNDGAGADPSAVSGHFRDDNHWLIAVDGTLSHLEYNSTEPQPVSVEVGPSLGSHPSQAVDDSQSSCAGVAAKRQKGVKSNWSNDAKVRTWLCASSCVRQLRQPCEAPEGEALVAHHPECACSRYRLTYDAGRAKYADAVHPVDCAQCGTCGTCGKPPGVSRVVHAETGCTERKVIHSLAGTPLRDGHKHARALRLAAKAILRDLWLEAKAWHESEATK